MTDEVKSETTSTSTRRSFLKGAVAATALGATGAGVWLGSNRRVSRSSGKKVIVIGIDGMDPRLCEVMMQQGLLPNLQKLQGVGGFSKLGTSTPPQSPVAWANFINGSGPGSHGIFDFVHRHPEQQSEHKCAPFYSAAETLPGEGSWEVGDYQIPLGWPFHKPAATILKRQGVPFWDFLDAKGVPTTFYDLPSNYPPSPSAHGHHRCICGMGTPDMLGTYGTYQYYAEDVPPEGKNEPAGGGKRYRISFVSESAKAELEGPPDSMRKSPKPIAIEFLIHRDRAANAAVIEIQGKRIVLQCNQWSKWIKLHFTLSSPWFVPSKTISGICRFYLKEVAPTFKLYVSPINIDPSNPAVQMSEPPSFIQDVSQKRGLFYTAGFPEDNKACMNNVFTDEEYVRQAENVLEERLKLFEYAVENYDDGLMFFYFSSSDLQSHIFWWDSEAKHPVRNESDAQKYFGHIWKLYQRLDKVIGEVVDRYGSLATIFVMSDHGFANFGRQFNLNSWLRDFGYLGPPNCGSVMADVDWSLTYAYGLGLNGLYLNLKGREQYGIVEPGEKAEELLTELKERLEAVTDVNGERVIRGVYRASEVYSGGATALAPDLIVGYARGYRASWSTAEGSLTQDFLLDNDTAWSADHCADAEEVPGILFCNRPFQAGAPSLVDVAPSILAEFGVPTPASMTGKSIFTQ
jgi:predicted AlkP superfamily phosphohydrolase/phosphomutase